MSLVKWWNMRRIQKLGLKRIELGAYLRELASCGKTNPRAVGELARLEMQIHYLEKKLWT